MDSNPPSRTPGRANGEPLGPGRLAQLACILEVMAPKPGNVQRCRDLPGLHLLDFLASALAIAGPLDRAAIDGVGVAVERAIEATRQVVATNTNLGMVLLLAPMAAVPFGIDLRTGVEDVLVATTVATHRAVYRAIRLARPGGMGSVEEQDIAEEPTLPLRAVMALAADRDLVARQYADGFRDVFDGALPALRKVLTLGRIHRDGDCRYVPDDAVATPRFADRPEGWDGTGPRRLAAGGGSSRGGLARSTGGGPDVRGIRRLAPRSDPPSEPRDHGRPGLGRLVRGPA